MMQNNKWVAYYLSAIYAVLASICLVFALASKAILPYGVALTLSLLSILFALRHAALEIKDK